MRSFLLSVAAAFVFGSAASAQSLHIEGNGRTTDLSIQDLRVMPHLEVHVDQHGHTHDFSGVPLGALLSKVGVDLSHPLSGRRLADVLRVTAGDGYQVVLALSEIDPATRTGQILVADADGGKPLGPDDGPFRMVVTEDLRPARSARQVVRIEVLNLSTSTKAEHPHQ